MKFRRLFQISPQILLGIYRMKVLLPSGLQGAMLETWVTPLGQLRAGRNLKSDSDDFRGPRNLVFNFCSAPRTMHSALAKFLQDLPNSILYRGGNEQLGVIERESLIVRGPGQVSAFCTDLPIAPPLSEFQGQ